MKFRIQMLLPLLALAVSACTSQPPAAQQSLEQMPAIGGSSTTPQYLSIPQFKSCLATQQVTTYSTWCLPANKPESCPSESWTQLGALQGREKLPPCSVR